MLEDTIDAAGRWRTLSLDVTNYGSRSETKRVQVLISPAVYAVTYGPGNPTPSWVAAAITRIDPPTWRRWHRTANRLAPLGVPVEIRDKGGKRCRPWTFPLFSKSPPVPFSVKSWRFVNEADGRHFERVWAEAVTPAGRPAEAFTLPKHLEPTEKARQYGHPYETWRKAGWTDALLIQHGYFKIAELRSTPTGRSLEAVEAAFRESVRKNVRENMSGILAGLRAMHSTAPMTPVPAAAPRPDPLRWRETTTQGTGVPNGVAVELDAEKIQVGVLRWRFVDLAEGVAYDAKRAKP